MGVKTHLSSFPAEALGGLTLGVTPLEMADVYATLADGGLRNSPIAITKVVFPDGHEDSNWGQPHRTKVLSEGVTAEETDILHQNVESGTATRSAIDCPTAAKTGTTSELVDAWLDGYTPNYSTVVWMGYPNKRVSMTDVHGEPQQGGYLPAEIWHAYMAAVTEGKSCTEFPQPKEPISYQPFYGKYASTGEQQATQENESESPTTKTPKHSHGGRKAPTPAGPESERVNPVPQAKEPVTPHAPETGPNVNKTGGAGPG
jgi:penicillin-binding protein 1A